MKNDLSKEDILKAINQTIEVIDPSDTEVVTPIDFHAILFRHIDNICKVSWLTTNEIHYIRAVQNLYYLLHGIDRKGELKKRMDKLNVTIIKEKHFLTPQKTIDYNAFKNYTETQLLDYNMRRFGIMMGYLDSISMIVQRRYRRSERGK